ACDPQTRAAVEAHLRDCPACAAKLAESRRLMGSLDIHWNESGIERLQRRIEEHGRLRRRFLRPFVRWTMTAAAAALVFIAVGLVWWLPGGNGIEQKVAQSEFALLLVSGKPVPVPGPVRDKARNKENAPEAIAVRSAPGGKEFRADLAKAQEANKLPP